MAALIIGNRRTPVLLATIIAACATMAAPGAAAAHPIGAAAAEAGWGTWVADPQIAIALIVLGGLYTRGVMRLWARDAGRSALPAWRGSAFAGGLIALSLALLSPIEALSGALLSAHMVQHVLLMSVAAPLLVLGAPQRTIAHALPVRSVRAMHTWWRARVTLRAVWRAVAHPVAVWLLYAGTLVGWHLPALYEAALHDRAVHALEHTAFLAVALLFWRAVSRAGRAGGMAHPAAVLFLFTAMLVHAGFSALIAFSDVVWYAHYETQATLAGLTALEDQQFAGTIMWVPGKLVHLVAILLVLRAWFTGIAAREGEVSPRRSDSYIERAAAPALATERRPR